TIRPQVPWITSEIAVWRGPLSSRGAARMSAARAWLRRALAEAGDHDRQHGLEDVVVGDQRELVAHPPDVRVLLLADRPVGPGPGAPVDRLQRLGQGQQRRLAAAPGQREVAERPVDHGRLESLVPR